MDEKKTQTLLKFRTKPVQYFLCCCLDCIIDSFVLFLAANANEQREEGSNGRQNEIVGTFHHQITRLAGQGELYYTNTTWLEGKYDTILCVRYW